MPAVTLDASARQQTHEQSVIFVHEAIAACAFDGFAAISGDARRPGGHRFATLVGRALAPLHGECCDCTNVAPNTVADFTFAAAAHGGIHCTEFQRAGETRIDGIAHRHAARETIAERRRPAFRRAFDLGLSWAACEQCRPRAAACGVRVAQGRATLADGGAGAEGKK